MATPLYFFKLFSLSRRDLGCDRWRLHWGHFWELILLVMCVIFFCCFKYLLLLLLLLLLLFYFVIYLFIFMHVYLFLFVWMPCI